MELLTYTEAAARAQVSEQTIRRRVRDGTFEEVMDGNRPKIRLSDLQKLYPSVRGGEFRRECRIIAFANQKGGVGKTTTCANLAAVFAKTFRVLAIDCDPQGNLSSAFGLDPDTLEKTTYNVLSQDLPIGQAILRPLADIPGLQVVGANLDLAEAELQLMNAMAGELKLRRVLEPLKHLYDFILIDAPPSLGVITTNALAAATDVIIPVNVGTFSLRAVNKLLAILTEVRTLNPDLRRIRPLANEVDNTNLSKDVITALETAFGDELLFTRVRKAQAVRDEQARGLPVTLKQSQGASAGASVIEDYEQLAREIAGESVTAAEAVNG